MTVVSAAYEFLYMGKNGRMVESSPRQSFPDSFRVVAWHCHLMVRTWKDSCSCLLLMKHLVWVIT